MKFEKAYIISWFGDVETKSPEKRLARHRKQLEWVKSIGLTPVVFAQNYKDEWFDDGVEYIKHYGDVLPPAHARVELLKQYYASDEDFCILMDNDVVMYPGNEDADCQTFVHDFRKMDIKDFDGIGVIKPVNAGFRPWKKPLKQNEMNKTHFWFQKIAICPGGMILLKNLKKHHVEVYPDTQFCRDADGELIVMEDLAFTLDVANTGLAIVEAQSLIMDVGAVPSTWRHDRDDGVSDEYRTEETRKAEIRVTKGFDIIKSKIGIDARDNKQLSRFMKRKYPKKFSKDIYIKRPSDNTNEGLASFFGA